MGGLNVDDEEAQALNPAEVPGEEFEVNFRSLWAYVILLTLIEIGGTFLVTRFAYDDTDVLSLGAGAVLFGALGVVLGFAIRAVGYMSVVNALWQSASIFALSLLSIFYFHERINRRQKVGLLLAGLASACFTR